ncbi:putative DMBT1-like protein [Glandiceps talaboti]
MSITSSRSIGEMKNFGAILCLVLLHYSTYTCGASIRKARYATDNPMDLGDVSTWSPQRWYHSDSVASSYDSWWANTTDYYWSWPVEMVTVPSSVLWGDMLPEFTSPLDILPGFISSWLDSTQGFLLWWGKAPQDRHHEPFDGDVRLVNGYSENMGRVEIYHDGEWGTVCDDEFDVNEAEVICRQLGYSHYASAHGNALYGEGSGTIWLDNLRCNGYESSLSDCRHLGWGNHNCGHVEDAGVTCIGT